MKHEWQRRGGCRRDRVFKVCLTIPEGVSEDQVMDYIEEAVCEYLKTDQTQTRWGNLNYLDTDLVTVKRRDPSRYKDL